MNDPARAAALDILTAALARKAGLDAALDGAALAGLSAQDRGFARALAMTTLRRLGVIDRLLAARLQREPPERVRMVLRLGVAQLFWLDTPAYAAVDSAVALAGAERGARGFKALVNAVLRGLARDGAPPDDPEALAPPWLYARWRAAYGEAEALALAAVIAGEPATDLTPRDPADAAALAEALEATVLPGGSLRREARGRVEDWPGFAEGRWWVQDAAAAIPARLLDARAGETVLDLCAAPGGKALQLAAAGAEVVALDRSAPRLRRLTESLARTGLAVEAVTANAETWHDERTFDAVLLDAPCTASGTFRRNPDVLWTLRPGDVAKLAAVQSRLLDAAAARVKPGGRLVYCVCSLEPEEGEAQARAFLKRHPDFATAPIAASEGGAPAASVTVDGWLRLLPHHLKRGMDGFFVARFVRAAR
ncbi:MAG TPA: RsmB/NOP family class I SAM-dependent RNA methyltransferase [Caulobacteraceae bacterium]|nr:RsmB/NOP family class I SAM-dependent RNA methyltransferase [Caulobacteraceae bacterium]